MIRVVSVSTTLPALMIPALPVARAVINIQVNNTDTILYLIDFIDSHTFHLFIIIDNGIHHNYIRQ